MIMKFHGVDYCRLIRSTYDAVHDALCLSIQSEPQLVANSVRKLPESINELDFLGEVDIQTSGIFIHAQPLVTCTDFSDSKPASVELGDLLLLRTEVDKGQISGRRALLLQAKKVSDLPKKPDNANQHHLYGNWPPFQYVRSTPRLNGKKRYLQGYDLYDACRYLLISTFNQPAYWLDICCPLCGISHTCALTVSPTRPIFTQHRCFSRELVNFLLGDAGKPYTSPPPKRSRNWDRVINDLITVTAHRKSVYMQKASNLPNSVRGQGRIFLSGKEPPTHGMLCLLQKGVGSDHWHINDATPSIPDRWPGADDDEGGGISIIEFVVTLGEYRRSNKSM